MKQAYEILMLKVNEGLLCHLIVAIWKSRDIIDRLEK